MEERYYGKSTPSQAVGERPFAFLSSTQVVADYALVVGMLRTQLNSTRVIAAGGSYGGMLAAWLRKRHPDLVDAALAASAPMLGYASTLLEQHRTAGFWETAERAYPCRNALGDAFRALWSATSEAAWQQIDTDFGLCPASRIRNASALESLIAFLQQQLSDLAFANYPYPVGSVPANPTAFACAKAQARFTRPARAQLGRSGHGWLPFELPLPTSLDAKGRSIDGWLPLRDALSWHYKSDGACLELDRDGTAYTPGFLPGAWTFQRCTDLVMAFEVPAASRMLLSCAAGFQANCAAAGQAALRVFCNSTFNAHVPKAAELQNFWGSDWTATGGGRRIIFSNGDLDPWSYGSVPDQIATGDADGPLVIHIAGGAHHLDLRSPNPRDPPSVVAAREKEAVALGRWLGL